jgi:hypothetical protein
LGGSARPGDAGGIRDLLERFEDLNFYRTEAKLDAYEEDFSVALFVAPAPLSESALLQAFNPASMRRHSIR